jgi:hypothetical protein
MALGWAITEPSIQQSMPWVGAAELNSIWKLENRYSKMIE